jgi:hypothetical protein
VQALFNAAGATELALSPASLNQAHTPGMARKCHPPTQRPRRNSSPPAAPASSSPTPCPPSAERPPGRT